jgi:transcription factor C subunit 6
MAGGNRNKFKVEERDRYGGGAWPAEAGIHRVAWHSGSGLSTAPLLASGMACGLCRVDWLPGRFAQDRIPYGDIAMVRMEDADREVIGYDEEEEVDELESEDGG